MTSRTESLAAVLARAGPRRVYGIDARGHGGVIGDLDGKTDGWRIPVAELVRVCVEGGGQWFDLPTVPEVADETTEVHPTTEHLQMFGMRSEEAG